MSAGNNSINAPAGALFVRSIQVYDSTTAVTGANNYLEKKDYTYLQQYVPSTETAKRGKPKYYAMWDQNTLYVAPTPDSAYKIELALNRN